MTSHFTAGCFSVFPDVQAPLPVAVILHTSCGYLAHGCSLSSGDILMLGVQRASAMAEWASVRRSQKVSPALYLLWLADSQGLPEKGASAKGVPRSGWPKRVSLGDCWCRRAQAAVGITFPWVGGPELYKKARHEL